MDKYINLTAYPEAIVAGTSYKIDVENGVFIESPYGTPQTTGWSCGPNAAARLLQIYGKNYPYQAVKFRAGGMSELTRFGIGLTGSRLRDVINSFGMNVSTKYESSLTSMVGELAKGKPVLALLQVGTTTDYVKIAGIKLASSTRPDLHWVLVNGYDAGTQEIHYVDNGNQRSISVASFYQQWNWSPGKFNRAIEGALRSAGLKGRTYIA